MKRTKLLAGLCMTACAALNFLALSVPGAQLDTEQTRSFPLAESPIIMLDGAHEEIQSGSATEFTLLSLDITHDTSGKLFGFARLDLNNVSSSNVVTTVTNEVVTTQTNEVVTTITNEVPDCVTNTEVIYITNEIVITTNVPVLIPVTNYYFAGTLTFDGTATNVTIVTETNYFGETNLAGVVTNFIATTSSQSIPSEYPVTTNFVLNITNATAESLTIPVGVWTTNVITEWITNRIDETNHLGEITNRAEIVTSITNDVPYEVVGSVVAEVTNVFTFDIVSTTTTTNYYAGTLSNVVIGTAANVTILSITNHYYETNVVGTVTNEFGTSSETTNNYPYDVITDVVADVTNAVGGTVTIPVSVWTTNQITTLETTNVYGIDITLLITNLLSTVSESNSVFEGVLVTNEVIVEVTNLFTIVTTNVHDVNLTNFVETPSNYVVVVCTTNLVPETVTNLVTVQVTNQVATTVTNAVPTTNITASLYGPISGSVNGTAGVKQKASISAKLEGVNPDDTTIRLSGKFSFTGTLEADALVVSGKGTLQNGNVKTTQTFENLTLETPTIASPVINADLFMMRLSGDENKGSGKLQAQGTMAIGEGSGDLLGSVSTKWDLGKSVYTEQGSLKGSGSSAGASVSWKVKSDSPDAGDATVSGKVFGQRFSEIAPFTP